MFFLFEILMLMFSMMVDLVFVILGFIGFVVIVIVVFVVILLIWDMNCCIWWVCYCEEVCEEFDVEEVVFVVEWEVLGQEFFLVWCMVVLSDMVQDFELFMC